MNILFSKQYTAARDNIMVALNCSPLQARHWLIKNAPVTITVSKRNNRRYVEASEPARSLINKLAGPDGVTLVKIMEIKSKGSHEEADNRLRQGTCGL